MSVALPLFEPQLYHAPGPAFFGTLVRESEDIESPLRSKVLPVTVMSDWLKAVKGSRVDTFISCGQFSVKKRATDTLQSIGLVWADIDNQRLARYEEQGAINFMLAVIDELGYPLPSIIIASGRGYHLKWLFDNAVISEDLIQWTALEKTINTALLDIGADQGATDAARLLRVVETTNQKIGLVAHVAWVNWHKGEPLRYDFQQLCFDIVPEQIITPEEYKEPRKPSSHVNVAFKTYNIRNLHYDRRNDIGRWCDMRGFTRWRGGVPEGYRDTVLFICAVGLSYVCPRSDWWNVMQRLVSEFCPTLPRKEWEHTMKPTYVRMLRAHAGEVGVQYRVSNEWIISRLGITREEMKYLKVIVDKDIAQDRHRARSREVMATLRHQRAEPKRSAKAQRNQEVLRLHAEGCTLRGIAKELGLSPQTAMRVLNAANSLAKANL